MTKSVRKEEVPSNSGLESYLAKISEYCPHLTASLNSEELHFYSVDLSEIRSKILSQSDEEVIFCFSIILAERLSWRSAPENNPTLFSENIIFENFDENSDPHPFVYPHWLSKCIYRQAGIVFGKFIVDEPILAISGSDVPTNTMNLYTVRMLMGSPGEKTFYDVNQKLQHDYENDVMIESFEEYRSKIRNDITKNLLVSDHLDMSELYISLSKMIENKALKTAKYICKSRYNT